MKNVLSMTDPSIGFILITLGVLMTPQIISHEKHKETFKIKCEAKGGVMFILSGARGRPKLECRNPKAFIEID